jgi:Fur family ferric uptake transcriptional regulator
MSTMVSDSSLRGQAGGGHATATAVDGIVAKLRASGGRITATRRATIGVLLAGREHRHLTAEEVASEVRARLPDVAESTIYRTLAALEELGVVTHVHLGHGPSTFHLADHDHRHLLCRHCQDIVEIPSHEFDELAQQLAQRYGFTISKEHFALVGECRSCR